MALTNHLRLFGLLALMLPLYGVVQLWLLSETTTRNEVQVVREPVLVPFEVPIRVEVPVDRVVFVPVPAQEGLATEERAEPLAEEAESGPPLLLGIPGGTVVAQLGAEPAVESVDAEARDVLPIGSTAAAEEVPVRATGPPDGAPTRAAAPAARPTPPIAASAPAPDGAATAPPVAAAEAPAPVAPLVVVRPRSLAVAAVQARPAAPASFVPSVPEIAPAPAPQTQPAPSDVPKVDLPSGQQPAKDDAKPDQQATPTKPEETKPPERDARDKDRDKEKKGETAPAQRAKKGPPAAATLKPEDKDREVDVAPVATPTGQNRPATPTTAPRRDDSPRAAVDSGKPGQGPTPAARSGGTPSTPPQGSSRAPATASNDRQAAVRTATIGDRPGPRAGAARGRGR